MIEHTFDISFTFAGYVSVGRSRPRIVFWYHIAIVSPCVFEVDYENEAVFDVVSSYQNRLRSAYFADIDSHLLKHVPEHVIGYFRLNEVGSIQVVKTIRPHYTILNGYNSLIGEILLVKTKIFENSL